MGDRFSSLIPQDNVYLIETADDLPDELSQWTLYNLRFDPGAGIGLYFSPDGTSLVRVDGGGGGGGAVDSFEGRTGIVVAIQADYAGFYVDSFNTRTGAVVPLVADYAGLYVDSFIGRTGAVVAVGTDYDPFYLQLAAPLGPPLFGSQNVATDVIFDGDCEFTSTDGLKLGPSCELELRNSADDTTWFMQHTNFFCNWGLAGVKFQDIFMDFSASFTHFRFGAPLFLQERAAGESNPSTFGQLWVKNDDPNKLRYTDGNGDEWTVDLTIV